MLNELQSSYDELLHKYAAAENALDKVSSAFKSSITSLKNPDIIKPSRCDLARHHHLAVEIARRLFCWQTRWLLLQQSVFTIVVDISIIVVIIYVTILGG